METNFKDIDNVKKELEFILTYDELKPHFDKAILKYRNKVAIPGFRKGKAPLDMVKKLAGDSVEYSSLEDIANEVFKKHILDNNIDIIDVGAITDFNYEPKTRFQFKIEFEVKPDITLEQYKGLELKKKVYKLDDKMIDEEVNYHKLQLSTLELDGEAMDDEYLVTIDVQNLDNDGNIIVGESQKDLKIYLGNKNIEKDFYTGLQHIKENETRIIDTKNSDGEPQKVKVTATKIEKIIFPELNEEFFKKITGKDDVKTVDEFKNSIKSELEKYYENISTQSLRNDLINELLKINDIDIPNVFVENILTNLAEDHKKRESGKRKISDEELDEFKKTNRVDAIKQAKWFLIREKIVELENIKVEEDDVKVFADDVAAKYNMPVDKLVELYAKSPDVKSQIETDKVFKLLIENAKVTEVEQDLNNQSENQ
ncbi:MAG TPA: trigger factor [Ignavibacteria bacterium]|nr:trigger factor [Ignavibacteria bacterium]